MNSRLIGRARTTSSLTASGAATDALGALVTTVYAGLAKTLYSTKPGEGVFSKGSVVTQKVYEEVLGKLESRINREFLD